MVKVSVVIPIYNVEEYLEECLDSVIKQTLKDIEILCINDGSTDNSVNILENYIKKDDRIKRYDQENSGLSVSRNHGLRLSQGKYVYFMDSDDILELNALEELYKLSESMDLDILIFKMINFIDGTDEKYTTPYYEMDFLKDFNKKIFNYKTIGKNALNMAVSAPGKFFRRELIYTTKFPEGLIFEDNVFFAEVMLKAKKVSFLDKHLYNRRIRENSITTTKTIKFADTITILNKIIDLARKKGIYNTYKKELIEKKIRVIHNRFSQVDEEYKEEFFNKIKKDFKKDENEYETDLVFLEDVDDKYRFIFRSAFTTDNYKEFELKIKEYHLKRINRNHKRRQKKLENQINIYKKKNNQILSSNSWKITKPLRKILGVLKNG